MKWEGRRQSANIEDRRGSGGRGGIGGLSDIFGGGNRGSGGGINFPMGSGSRSAKGGGMSLWMIVIVGAIMWFVFGINPLTLLGGMTGGGMGVPGMSAAPTQQTSTAAPGESDKMRQFVAVVLADTEDVWEQIFRASGETYRQPSLVLFSGQTPTACGTGDAAMGPFYCPGDQKVYIDLRFFEELGSRFGAAGDFAQAYVIAHEVGHHVQTLLGISTQVARAKRGASAEEANALSVRQELQADCFAGVWASLAERSKSILEPGDLEEALRAAAAVGDDTIQRKSRGVVVPESFTHGSAEQRQRWFMTGFKSGQVNSCDTFKASRL